MSERDKINRLIENSDLVIKVYGYWPSFHDSEVVDFGIHTTKIEEKYVTDIKITILHRGQDNPQWKRAGPTCCIEISCRNVSNVDLKLNDIAGGNWIQELNITGAGDVGVDLELVPLAGLDLRLKCEVIEVAGIYPVPL
ncbi:Imm50 family immunity protein [Burkholderia sp. BE17]|uniref:Imm50 family immunity protein n=1 Tax=Burkholderia sp. BE17 TaxID=2656644 RepID=UPI00128B94A0|nr:Imm50 family immunity protein [Burkholderia sp. BE17]MPV68712.1 hypothetical protein [Burkholderia sp. BE17]